MQNGGHLSGSHIGSKKEALEMLDLVAKHGIKSWIEEIPIRYQTFLDSKLIT